MISVTPQRSRKPFATASVFALASATQIAVLMVLLPAVAEASEFGPLENWTPNAVDLTGGWTPVVDAPLRPYPAVVTELGTCEGRQREWSNRRNAAVVLLSVHRCPTPVDAQWLVGDGRHGLPDVVPGYEVFGEGIDYVEIIPDESVECKFGRNCARSFRSFCRPYLIRVVSSRLSC
jgi:hypothetical protein